MCTRISKKALLFKITGSWGLGTEGKREERGRRCLPFSLDTCLSMVKALLLPSVPKSVIRSCWWFLTAYNPNQGLLKERAAFRRRWGVGWVSGQIVGTLRSDTKMRVPLSGGRDGS